MIYLPDVNLWLALSALSHVHHPAAMAWDREHTEVPLAFCRVTQMALLRLLTNPRVMAGDPLTPSRAWNVLESLAREPHVQFAPEPAGLVQAWRDLTRRHHHVGKNFWTDSYLAAFAQTGGYRLVTFDAGFRRYRELDLELLV